MNKYRWLQLAGILSKDDVLLEGSTRFASYAELLIMEGMQEAWKDKKHSKAPSAFIQPQKVPIENPFDLWGVDDTDDDQMQLRRTSPEEEWRESGRKRDAIIRGGNDSKNPYRKTKIVGQGKEKSATDWPGVKHGHREVFSGVDWNNLPTDGGALELFQHLSDAGEISRKGTSGGYFHDVTPFISAAMQDEQIWGQAEEILNIPTNLKAETGVVGMTDWSMNRKDHAKSRANLQNKDGKPYTSDDYKHDLEALNSANLDNEKLMNTGDSVSFGPQQGEVISPIGSDDARRFTENQRDIILKKITDKFASIDPPSGYKLINLLLAQSPTAHIDIAAVWQKEAADNIRKYAKENIFGSVKRDAVKDMLVWPFHVKINGSTRHGGLNAESIASRGDAVEAMLASPEEIDNLKDTLSADVKAIAAMRPGFSTGQGAEELKSAIEAAIESGDLQAYFDEKFSYAQHYIHLNNIPTSATYATHAAMKIRRTEDLKYSTPAEVIAAVDQWTEYNCEVVVKTIDPVPMLNINDARVTLTGSNTQSRAVVDVTVPSNMGKGIMKDYTFKILTYSRVDLEELSKMDFDGSDEWDQIKTKLGTALNREDYSEEELDALVAEYSEELQTAGASDDTKHADLSIVDPELDDFLRDKNFIYAVLRDQQEDKNSTFKGRTVTLDALYQQGRLSKKYLADLGLMEKKKYSIIDQLLVEKFASNSSSADPERTEKYRQLNYDKKLVAPEMQGHPMYNYEDGVTYMTDEYQMMADIDTDGDGVISPSERKAADWDKEKLEKMKKSWEGHEVEDHEDPDPNTLDDKGATLIKGDWIISQEDQRKQYTFEELFKYLEELQASQGKSLGKGNTTDSIEDDSVQKTIKRSRAAAAARPSTEESILRKYSITSRLLGE